MSPEEVPDEWVKQAAHAFHWSYAALVDPEAPPVDYDSLPPSLRERYEQMARHGLAAVLPQHKAAVLNAEADEMERYGSETYWRDDSPFHAQGRFHAKQHAERTRERAAAEAPR